MKTNYLKKWWAVLLLMLTMGAMQVNAQRTVTFTGARTAFASKDGVTVGQNGPSNSSKTIPCLASGGVQYISLNSAGGNGVLFTLDSEKEKIDKINIIWMSNTANQITPVVFGETVTYESGMIYATNGGFAATKTIASSGSTNCDAGDDITFPTTTTVKSVFVHRRINNTSAQNTPLAVYENFAARLNNSTNTTYSQAWGAGQNVFVGQVILTISEIGPSTPIIGVDDETINFGTIAANATETVTTGVFGEILTGDLTVTVTGTGAAAFTPSKTTITKAEAEAGATLGVTFNAAKNLAVGDYAATITISGGGAESVQIAVSGSIKAADLTPPMLSTIAPLETAKLPLSGQIVLTFDEPIKFSGAAPQFEGVDGGISDDNQSQVIFAYGDVAHSSTIILTIAAGAITDLAGNPFAGDTWSWTSETPAPEIDLQSANANISVKAGVAFSIMFDIYNATNAVVTGLPAGVGSVYNPGSPGSLTISGPASALENYPDIFNYTITPTPMPGYDGAPVTRSGTITVKDPNSKNVAFLYTSTTPPTGAGKIFPVINSAYDVTVINITSPNTPAQMEEIIAENYDLIILHEAVPSQNNTTTAVGVMGSYIGQVPILNMKSHMYGKANSNWPAGAGNNNDAALDKVSVIVNDGFEDHQIFNGVTLDADNRVTMANNGGVIRYVTGVQNVTNIARNGSGAAGNVAILEDGSGVEKYMMIALSAAAENMTDDGLLIIKNACDYLMGISDTPTEEPLKSFGIKWSIANINGQSITFDELKLQEGQTQAMEVYFEWAQNYENCLLFINETYVGNGAPIVWGEDNTGNGAFFDFGTDISQGLDAVIDIVRPTPSGAKGVQKAINSVYPEGTTIASYTLTIPAEVVATGLGADKTNSPEPKDCFNVLGVQVDCESNGIVIKRFTDGSTKKTLNK